MQTRAGFHRRAQVHNKCPPARRFGRPGRGQIHDLRSAAGHAPLVGAGRHRPATGPYPISKCGQKSSSVWSGPGLRQSPPRLSNDSNDPNFQTESGRWWVTVPALHGSGDEGHSGRGSHGTVERWNTKRHDERSRQQEVAVCGMSVRHRARLPRRHVY